MDLRIAPAGTVHRGRVSSSSLDYLSIYVARAVTVGHDEPILPLVKSPTGILGFLWQARTEGDQNVVQQFRAWVRQRHGLQNP